MVPLVVPMALVKYTLAQSMHLKVDIDTLIQLISVSPVYFMHHGNP